jgi:hypothetical protein
MEESAQSSDACFEGGGGGGGGGVRRPQTRVLKEEEEEEEEECAELRRVFWRRRRRRRRRSAQSSNACFEGDVFEASVSRSLLLPHRSIYRSLFLLGFEEDVFIATCRFRV